MSIWLKQREGAEVWKGSIGNASPHVSLIIGIFFSQTLALRGFRAQSQAILRSSES